jgi:hypothetical protein
LASGNLITNFPLVMLLLIKKSEVENRMFTRNRHCKNHNQILTVFIKFVLICIPKIVTKVAEVNL